MKVVITGGAGFIGSHLADRLLASGHEVLVIDNYATARRDNLRPRSSLAVVEGTIADADLVRKAFDDFGPDQVVHAAASYKAPDAWHEDVRTSIHGTINVVQASQAVGVQRVVYFQSALCYGLQPQERPVTLRHPLRPEGSSYAISKTAAEHYLTLSGVELLTFRLAHVYGPRNMSGPLPAFFERLSTNRRCVVTDTRRDFVFIDDLIALVVQALHGQGRPGAYHVSTGRDHSIIDVFALAARALGIAAPKDFEFRRRGEDDAATILLDPSATEEEFGWRASTPLAEGIVRAIDYYRTYGVMETYTHLKSVA
jgi:UDP-glucose 4-epimerase